MPRYMAVAAASQKATSLTVKRKRTAADSDVIISLVFHCQMPCSSISHTLCSSRSREITRKNNEEMAFVYTEYMYS